MVINGNYGKLNRYVKSVRKVKLGKLKGLVINDKYEIWNDGTCYSYNGNDLPNYVFELRKIILG
jgi:hypothetical protein